MRLQCARPGQATLFTEIRFTHGSSGVFLSFPAVVAQRSAAAAALAGFGGRSARFGLRSWLHSWMCSGSSARTVGTSQEFVGSRTRCVDVARACSCATHSGTIARQQCSLSAYEGIGRFWFCCCQASAVLRGSILNRFRPLAIPQYCFALQDEETDVEGARIVIPRSIKQCQRMVEVSSLNGYMRLLPVPC